MHFSQNCLHLSRRSRLATVLFDLQSKEENKKKKEQNTAPVNSEQQNSNNNDEDLYPKQLDNAEKNHQCLFKVTDKQEGKIFSNKTGRLMQQSRSRMNYMMILY